MRSRAFPAAHCYLLRNLYDIAYVTIESEADLFDDIHRNWLILSELCQRTAADAYKIAKLQFFHVPLHKLVPQGLIRNSHILASSWVFYFKIQHLSSVKKTVIIPSEKLILRNQNNILTKQICKRILKMS